MQTPPPSSPDPEQSPIPNNPLDMALHMATLRRLVVSWRERASAAPEAEARIYRRAEADLTNVITAHGGMQDLWSTMRSDLVRGIIDALDVREETRPRVT